MDKKCIYCKYKYHGYYYDVSSNKYFASKIKRKVSESKRLIICEPCLKRVRTELVHEGKNYQTIPAEIFQTRYLHNGPHYIDGPMPLNLSQQPDGQLVEPPVESSQQPVNESVSSEQEPREVTLETNITPKHKPMPMSLKRKLAELSYNRIPSLSNVVQRKSNSMRIISNSRNNDPDSLK